MASHNFVFDKRYLNPTDELAKVFPFKGCILDLLRMCRTSTREPIRLQSEACSTVTHKTSKSVVAYFLTVTVVQYTFVDICQEITITSLAEMIITGY